MPYFEVRQSAKLNLTSYSGLALLGQCFEIAQVHEVIDPKIAVLQGMKTSDLSQERGRALESGQERL